MLSLWVLKPSRMMTAKVVKRKLVNLRAEQAGGKYVENCNKKEHLKHVLQKCCPFKEQGVF